MGSRSSGGRAAPRDGGGRCRDDAAGAYDIFLTRRAADGSCLYAIMRWHSVTPAHQFVSATAVGPTGTTILGGSYYGQLTTGGTVLVNAIMLVADHDPQAGTEDAFFAVCSK